MSSSQEILLGRIALDLGVVTSEQLEQCIRLQDSQRKPLGELLVARGFLSREALKKVLALQDQRLAEKAEFSQHRRSEMLFGTLAIERKFLTREQLYEALRQQDLALIHGRKSRLGEVLVESEFMTAEQVEEILRLQARKSDEVSLPGYEVVSKLGEGGMGAVYLAKQLSMDRAVALKVLSSQWAKDRNFVQRFLTEARNSARLNHPNIIRGFDVLTHNNHYYYVMEYVEGESLRTILESGPLPEDKVLDLAVQMTSALQHAEERKMVHRDIKPDNILVNEDGVAKLCDLGLSKQESSQANLTAAGTVLGTPNYMSPEQARGAKDLDIRSDLYSLGATLYHALTGRPPFVGSNPVQTLHKHLKEAPVAPSARVAGISAEMDAILLRMLAKQASERPASAAALLKELSALQAARNKARLLADVKGPVRRVKTSSVPARRATAPVPKPVADLEPDEDGVEAAPRPTRGTRRMGLAAGAVAVLLVLGTLGWWLGRPGTGGGAAVTPPTPAANHAPMPVNQGPDLTDVEAEYNTLMHWAEQNPGRDALNKVKAFVAANGANRFGDLAGLKFNELQRAYDAQAEAALKTARQQAQPLVVAARFVDARTMIAAVGKDYPESTAASRVNTALGEVDSDARKHFAARRDAAETAAKENRQEDAISIYREFDGFYLQDLADQARTRIAELEVAATQRDQEVKERALVALRADFEKEVDEIFSLLRAREFSKVSSRYFAHLGNTKYRELWSEIDAHKKRLDPFLTFWKDFEAGAKKLVGSDRVFSLTDGRSARGRITDANADTISVRDGLAVIGVKVRELPPKEIVAIALLALDPKRPESHLKCAIFCAIHGDSEGARAALDHARSLGGDVAAYGKMLRLDR